MKISIDLHALIAESDTLQTMPQTADSGAYRRLLIQIEPAFLHCLLEYTQHNQSHAARLAGINYSTLVRKLKHYGMSINKRVVNKPPVNKPSATQEHSQ